MPPSDAPVGVVGEDDAGASWATAQTFVAGESGFLDVVELSLAATGGRFRLTVQGVTPSGTPDGAPSPWRSSTGVACRAMPLA
jgi:hypothetical protein